MSEDLKLDTPLHISQIDFRIQSINKVINYNEYTGEFIWLISPARSVKKGSAAGKIKKDGYRIITYKGKEYRSGRLAFFLMNGFFPTNYIDHINHNRLDDRWINLREVTVKENNKNQSICKCNVSGFAGVSWTIKSRSWRSHIKSNYKSYNLGDFIERWDAICSRKSAEYKHGFHVNHGGVGYEY